VNLTGARAGTCGFERQCKTVSKFLVRDGIIPTVANRRRQSDILDRLRRVKSWRRYRTHREELNCEICAQAVDLNWSLSIGGLPSCSIRSQDSLNGYWSQDPQ